MSDDGLMEYVLAGNEEHQRRRTSNTNFPFSATDEQSSKNHPVNLQDKSGKSLLIYSCARGMKSTVEELSLDRNIDPNLEDIEGNTALIHATQAGHTYIVELLVERFSNLQIDHVNKLGQTALIKAAINGRVNCAKILLKAGADIYKKDNSRQFTAFDWAEFVGRTECAQVIGDFMDKRMVNKKTSAATQDNLKQIACVAAIPLIGAEMREMPTSVRPRVCSAPPTSCGVKIKITPPSSPLWPSAAAAHRSQQQFPFRAIGSSSKSRPLTKKHSGASCGFRRPKSSCS